jgi:hypothetical protein
MKFSRPLIKSLKEQSKMNYAVRNTCLALAILFLQNQVLAATDRFTNWSGFSYVPSFEITTGLLESRSCVLILTDEHPIPYASGQDRYHIELVLGQNDAFQLVHAEPVKFNMSCSGYFDTRTNQYKTTVYYGTNLYKEAPYMSGKRFDNNAVQGKVEIVLKYNGNSEFTIADHSFVRDYMSEAIYVNADDTKNVVLPSSIDLNNLVVTLNPAETGGPQEELTSPGFVSANGQGLVLTPMSADVGYYNLRLNWNNEIEYLTVVVNENPSKLEAEPGTIDITEFNPAKVQAIPVRVITYDPSSFVEDSEFQRVYSSYGNRGYNKTLNALHNMGLDETTFFELCGELPSDYDRSNLKTVTWNMSKNSTATSHTPCMVNELMSEVNKIFSVYSDIGVRFTVDEIVKTDYADFDMTMGTTKVLEALKASSLAKSGYINIFYLPFVAGYQGQAYLNDDINGPNGASIVRANQSGINSDANITAHELGHVLGVAHLTTPSSYKPKSNRNVELKIPSFLEIGANAGCAYLNVMSSFTGGCENRKFGLGSWNTLVYGNLIKKVFARQLYEWGLTDQKVAL